MEYNMNFLKESAEKLGVSLSEVQLKQFLTYYEMLIEKNKVMNLTSITKFDEVMKKHFLDSISLIKCVDLNNPFSLRHHYLFFYHLDD